MKKLIMCFTFILLTLSCNTTEPPPDAKPTITLTLEDAASVEARIKLTTSNLQFPATVTLKQNSTVTQDIVLSYADTVIYIDSLLPNTTYTYHATMQPSNQAEVKSNVLSVTTMDTTSHNFTWQTFEFGQHSSSVLFDVAIIDENNIWAVGEIYMNDSLGNPEPHAYNAVHWDGSEWELKRIYYYGNCSAVKYPPLKAIWAFSENDIVITNGGSIGWFDGNTVNLDCGVNPLLTGAINKIWSKSSNDLYVVGNNGSIAHYQNGSWSKIESGTDLHIYDISGEYNSGTGDYEIIVVAANRGLNFDKKILKINSSNNVTLLSNSDIPFSIHGIWFKNRTYYVVGSGMYKKYDITTSLGWEALHQGISNYYLDAISGNDLNDIIICGAFGELLHFNGVEWKNDYEEPNLGSGAYGSVKITGDLVIATGLNNSKAVILVGRR